MTPVVHSRYFSNRQAQVAAGAEDKGRRDDGLPRWADRTARRLVERFDIEPFPDFLPNVQTL